MEATRPVHEKPALNLLVIGELFQDVYLDGMVGRLNAEAPSVPLVDVQRKRSVEGGAGNVVRHLKALGHVPHTLYQDGTYPKKTRVLNRGELVVRFDEFDSCLPLTYLPYIPNLQGILISDYGKGMFTPEAIDLLCEKLDGQVPLFLDTKQPPALWHRLLHSTEVCWLFPNQHEWDTYVDEYLLVPQVIRTEGTQGMTALVHGMEVGHVPARYVEQVCSVSGAGDSVVAAFAVAYCQGQPPLACMRAAAEWAAHGVEVGPLGDL